MSPTLTQRSPQDMTTEYNKIATKAFLTL